MPISYIIFDFDHTLSAFHLHYECMKLLSTLTGIVTPSPLVDEVVEWDQDLIDLLWGMLQKQHKLRTTGETLDWQVIFNTLIHHDYHVAIASFSCFKPIIERFLQDIVGLTHEQFKKVYVEAWLPSYQENKNCHLDRILQGKTTKKIDWRNDPLSSESRQKAYQKIILIDDSLANVEAVIQLSNQTHGFLVPAEHKQVTTLIKTHLSQHLAITFAS